MIILSIFLYFHLESYSLLLNSYKFNKINNNNNHLMFNPGMICLSFPRANHCRHLVLNALNNDDFNINSSQDEQLKLEIFMTFRALG